jgi:DNA-binding response OmpR family regulator
LTTTTKKILVIEDHPDTLMFMTLALQNQGFSVIEATNGNDAMLHVQSGETPDLVLVDFCMPGCNGKDFIKKFRDQAGFEKTPIYFTSGWGDLEEVTKDCGAQGYIKKPVDLDSLIVKVGEVFAH